MFHNEFFLDLLNANLQIQREFTNAVNKQALHFKIRNASQSFIMVKCMSPRTEQTYKAALKVRIYMIIKHAFLEIFSSYYDISMN